MNKNLHIGLLFLFLFLSKGLFSQTIIYVKPNGSGNGSSWDQAQGNLRQVIASASKGSQIWVAQGIYTPTVCTNCTYSDRHLSFEIPDGIAIYGGFVGYETSPAQRNFKASTSVLSGNIDQDSTTKNNSFNVIFTRNVSSQTLIDGFTISDGNANDTLPVDDRTVNGGGWFNDAHGDGGYSSPTIRNCIFRNNTTAGFAGAMINSAAYNGHCETSYQNCQFLNNSSLREGGAVRNVGTWGGNCSPVFSFCQFIGNQANAAGGSVFNDGQLGVCSPSFLDCRFIRNTTVTYGGAIYNMGKNGTCLPVISNCLFWSNKAFSAAGVYCLGSEHGNCSPSVTNCIFYKNQANTCGSVYANASDSTGTAAVKVYNSIIWGNMATTAPYIRSIESYPILDYSIIDAPNAAAVYLGNVNGHGTCGAHVLFNQNPLFVDPDNGDFHLQPQSPAINAGLESVANNIGLALDLDSLPRIINHHIDIGAFEYVPPTLSLPYLVASPVSQTLCTHDVVVLKAAFFSNNPFVVQWYKNDVAIPYATADSLSFPNGVALSDSGLYKCVARNGQNLSVASDIAVIKVQPTVFPSLNIVANKIPQCEGDTIAIAANWSNNNVLPRFDWRVDDQSLGLADTTTICRIAVQANSARYSCRIISNQQCAQPNVVASNELQFSSVGAKNTATLALAKINQGVSCMGDTILFTTATTNVGDAPQYQWYRNNTLINNNTFFLRSANLNNNDTIKATVTASQKCLVNNHLESNKIVVNVTPRTITNLRVAADKPDICSNDTVVLTAIPLGGGLTPTYQWFLNDLKIEGANNFVYKTNTFKNADKIYAKLYSSEQCVSVIPTVSNNITISVKAWQTPSLTLAASKTDLCTNEKITFSTNGTALGSTPQYIWMRNGLNLNISAPSYTTDSLQVGDTIQVVATSSERCVTTLQAPSNILAPTVRLCTGIFENNEQNIQIFPNPSTDTRFTLLGLDNMIGEKTLTVFNANAQLIFSKKIENNQNDADVDFKMPLPNGTYWVKIANGERYILKKWILLNN